MVDCDYFRFGCNAKLPAQQLMTVSRKSCISELSDDCSNLVGRGRLFATVDSVFSCSKCPKVFAKAAFYHCVNDLVAAKVSPTDCLVSYGMGQDTTQGEQREIFDEIANLAKSNDIRIVNQHTYLPDQTCLTFTFIGQPVTENELDCSDFGENYDIVLSKPLGGALSAMVSDIGDDKELEMLSQACLSKNPIEMLPFISSSNLFSTDISGFGLMGHLASISKKKSLQCILYLDKIRAVGGLVESKSLLGIETSEKCNFRDFSEYVEFTNTPSEALKKVLFSGETNGPLLIFSKHEYTDELLSNVSAISEASIIGSCVKGNSYSIRVE